MMPLFLQTTVGILALPVICGLGSKKLLEAGGVDFVMRSIELTCPPEGREILLAIHTFEPEAREIIARLIAQAGESDV